MRVPHLLLALGVPLACALASAAAPVDPAARPFDPGEVRLLDGPFRDAMLRNQKYLRSLEPDRLLHTFRLNAGLPSSAQPLGGWEAPKCELRGHCLGHYLSACALMAAWEQDEVLKKNGDAIVAELAKVQDALAARGATPGYLSAYPESFIDRVEAAKPVWAPYYTLHKILAGLLDMHVLTGNAQALEILKRKAGWLKTRLDKLAPEQVQKMLGNEFGGMNEVLANLYAVTGDPEHLRLARAFDHRFVFDPLARGEDRLDGLHANTQVPKMIGAAREYALTGETRYRDIADVFWRRVALARSYVIGGHSDHEHFFPVDQFAKHLGPETAETCNTYNMLKLTRLVFGWTPTAEVMDFHERALYNHILASQDPETGQYVYLMSLKPGHFKTYSRPLDSFWCCVGTGMENHTKYADTIYFRGADGSLYVNLFIASELTWKEKGIALRQETAFPDEGATRLAVSCAAPVKAVLRLRRPAWAGEGFAVAVNGQEAGVDGKPGSYVALDRTWKDGDRVEVRLPMRLRTEPLPGDPSHVAFLCGPVVLAGEMGRTGIETFDFLAKGQTDHVRVPTPAPPVLVGDPKDVTARVEPVAGKPLTFRTKGLARPDDVTLLPFFRMHRQRYAVYWAAYDAATWDREQARRAEEEKARLEVERRRVDDVRIGEPQPETDHAMQGERSEAGDHLGRRWRHATDGGWFSYRMKVLPDRPVKLSCTYWGSDIGRVFDILVDGVKVATQALDGGKPNAFFDVEYALPAEVTKGKDTVTVKFQAPPGKTAGGVFGVRVLKAE
jgi:DUF1680 family protein